MTMTISNTKINKTLIVSLFIGILSLFNSFVYSQTNVQRYYVKEEAQGIGDGSSWSNARYDIQGAINDLNKMIQEGTINSGEVWVAAGKYRPSELIQDGDSKFASFIMYEGIYLYGGFAGNETSIEQRLRNEGQSTEFYSWDFRNETILTGDLGQTEAQFDYSSNNHSFNTKFINNSYHVVWFATNGFANGKANALTKEAVLDGFTITHGNASSTDDGLHTGKGGGAFIVGGSILRNCNIYQNRSVQLGGGVYADGGGNIENCIISENQCEGVNITAGYGGGITLNNSGIVKNSIIVNNVARNGGGISLYNTTALNALTSDMVVVNSVISNNNAHNEAGGVYFYKGGVINQSTITHNYCIGEGVLHGGVRNGRTGGVYIYQSGVMFNTVCWGNDAVTQSVQYFFNKTISDISASVYHCALSSSDLINWEGTENSGNISLAESNKGTGSDFYPVFLKANSDVPGVFAASTIADNSLMTYFDNYNWKPEGNSSLREKGADLHISQTILPPSSQVQSDILNNDFKIKSDVGAYCASQIEILYTQTNESGANIFNIYVNPSLDNIENSAGDSWTNPISSLNDALIYCRDNASLIANNSNDRFRIHVKEGTVYTYGQYMSDLSQSSSILVPSNVQILGSYSSENPNERNPMLFPTLISGDIGVVNDYSDNSFHCITIDPGAKNVELDGLHVAFGNSTSVANYPYGGGVLIYDNASVTMKNCIVENCSAVQGAAIYVTNGSNLSLINCIINNNSTTGTILPSAIFFDQSSVVNNSSIIGCTIVKNVGYGVYNNSTSGNLIVDNSWIWNNSKSEREERSLPQANEVYHLTGNLTVTNCALDVNSTFTGNNNITTLTYDRSDNSNYTYPSSKNATKHIGVNQTGFDTYYGGYADWTPTNMNPVVNIGTLTSTDMVGNNRTYGGKADIGALENISLPIKGEVVYVRQGYSDNNDGLTWATAKGSITSAQSVSGVKEIWVGAGTYNGNFTLTLGIDVYGGFLAIGNPGKNIDERNISHKIDEFKTILQGNGTKPTNTFSSALDRVLNQTSTSSTSTTTWEGFIIENGLVYRNLSSSNLGGAGALIRQGGRLKNCLVQNCVMVTNNNSWANYGGAGVYCTGGLIENCIIRNNYLASGSNTHLSAAGLFMNGGQVTNCVIADNESGTQKAVDVVKAQVISGFSQSTVSNVLGAAVLCAGTSYFYNCTLAYNKGRGSAAVVGGVWDNVKNSQMINCILWGNVGYGGTVENLFQFGVSGMAANSNLQYCYVSAANFQGRQSSAFRSINSIDATTTLLTSTNDNRYALLNTIANQLIVNASGSNTLIESGVESFLNLCRNNQPFDDDYILKLDATKCINTGYQLAIEGTPSVAIPTYNLFDGSLISSAGITLTNTPFIEVDAAGYNRTQNCTVDKGAYEFDGDLFIEGVEENEDNIEYYTFYVSQNGKGIASACTSSNSACASKLQEVLDAAGKYKANNKLVNVRVKLAATTYYPIRKEVSDFTSQKWSEDERTFSFFVPRGIEIWGGYNDDFTTRDILKNKTILSGNRLNSSSSSQYMYHVVTFTDRLYNGNSTTPNWSDVQLTGGSTILDGLFIQEGNASGQSDTHKQGGGGIIPSYGHIRNCIVKNCYATENGGGLYLIPGATVSGTTVTENEAKQGAGIYVEALSEDNNEPAKIFNSTVIKNTTYSGGRGGGIYFGRGNVYINMSVFWRNTANSGKNVYGVTDEMLQMPINSLVDNDGNVRTEHYPFNYSAVEAIRQPGENNFLIETENDRGVRFKSDNSSEGFTDYVYPTKGSLLISVGVNQDIWLGKLNKSRNRTGGLLHEFNLSATDYSGLARWDSISIAVDVGARASVEVNYNPGKPIFTRLFVTEGIYNIGMQRYGLTGSSFRNPFNSLEDALNYINNVRSNSDSSNKYNEVDFEIFIAGGTYYPFAAPGDYSINQRKSSFTIPQGVSIYGGFNGAPNNEVDWDYYQPDNYKTEIDEESDNKPTNLVTTEMALANREKVDHNRNGIYEPWEFLKQTILSGEVNSFEGVNDAYHVLYNNTSSATNLATYTGLNKSILLDGVYLMNGEAIHGEDSINIDRDNSGYYKGGAICIEDTTTSLIIRRCMFLNNKGRMGGAIYSKSPVDIYGSIFAQNAAKSEKNNTGSENKDGYGSVLYMNGASLQAINSIFANNEADVLGTIYGDPAGLFTMNCNIVRNKAAQYPACYLNGNYNNGNNLHINTLFWGNESTTDNVIQNALNANDEGVNAVKQVIFSAYEEGRGPIAKVDEEVDERDSEVDSANALSYNNNIHLSSTNWTLDGPCFSRPSTEAGVIGYNYGHNWAINTQTLLLDAGWGRMKQTFDTSGAPSFTTDGHNGAYYKLAFAKADKYGFAFNNQKLMPYLFDDAYMNRSNGTSVLRISTDPNVTHENAYIDIGVYEYQQVKLVIKDRNEIDTIYVRTQENADVPADGTSWLTATSDLQRAMETLLSSRNGKKKMIFMAEGEYAPTYMIRGNRGFVINNNVIATLIPESETATVHAYPVNDLIIRGGYSDIVLDNRLRNFNENKTIIKSIKGRNTKHLFTIEDATYGDGKFYIDGVGQGTQYISFNTHPTKIYKNNDIEDEELYTIASKTIKEKSVIPISFEGITFSNEFSSEDGSVIKTAHDMKGCFVMNNCEILLTGRDAANSVNDKSAVNVKGAVIMNTLFHSNEGHPLSGDSTTVMNCTFAMNGGVLQLDDKSTLTNSVLWKNNLNNGDTQPQFGGTITLARFNSNAIENYIPNENEDSNEGLSSMNDDLLNGPNFVRPAKAEKIGLGYDFSLNASKTLLDKGDGTWTNIEYGTNGETINHGEGAYFTLLYNTPINDDYTYDTTGEATNIHNLLDPAYKIADYEGNKFGEVDLAFNTRFFASTSSVRRIDRGAFEFDKALQPLLYVDPLSAQMNGDGSSWALPLRSLQSAIDLAYVRSLNSGHSYILCKRGTFSDMIFRQGITVYASVQNTENRLAKDLATNDDLLTGIDVIVNSRPGLVETNAERTVIKSLVSSGFDATLDEDYNIDKVYTLVDGFEISGNDSILPTAQINSIEVNENGKSHNLFTLRNTVIWGNANSNISTDIDKYPIVYNNGGLLYNVLVHGNEVKGDYAHVVNAGNGRVINNTIATNTSYTLRNEAGNNNVINNLLCGEGVANLNPYFDRIHGQPNHLAYQLSETANSAINQGIEVTNVMGVNFDSDRDILGNNRRYTSKVDIGCFETWRVPENSTQYFTPINNMYPHAGSVVYAMENAILSLGDDMTSIFTPSYLLLKNDAQLFGNGKRLNLSYLAVERNFTSGYNFFSLPFSVSNQSNGTLRNGITTLDGESVSLDFYIYDGEERAKSLYKYHDSNSPYWVKSTEVAITPNLGYYLDNNNGDGLRAASSYRFTAQAATPVYSEDGKEKNVYLTQYNLTNPSGVQFTYKENMGWNLFGTPYLCRYDWQKMQVPHVLYGYDNDLGYQSFYSWEPSVTGGAPATENPMFGAYFTQTAIIQGPEKLRFPIVSIDDIYQTGGTTRALSVQISMDETEVKDQVAIFASYSPSQSLQYRLGEDAIKMMSDKSLPQIYVANSSDNRFSIITSVDTEAVTSLGVSTPQSGNYTISISEESLIDYEYVILNDAYTNQSIDLTSADYSFVANQAEDSSKRFTLSFKAIESNDNTLLRVYNINGGVCIEGLMTNDRIMLYDTAGRIVESQVASRQSEVFYLEKGVYMIKVVRDEMKDWTQKIAVN